MKKKLWIFLMLCLLVLIAGCGKEVMKEKSKKSVGETETHQEAFDHVYPLTGLPTNKEIDQRVVAVMINNFTKARPQSGLYKADVVYEILAEGNITRFLALFQSEKPEVIGPVRSARDYFINLSKGYHALYICHGNSPEAKAMLDAGEVDNLNGLYYDGTLFWRSKARVAPHNSYISFKNIEKGAQEKNYAITDDVLPLPFLTENEVKNIQGSPANDVMISYSKSEFSNVEYSYDKKLGKYKRFNGGQQTVDLETKTPVLLDNIFIIETDHKIIDNKGRRDVDITSGGNGYLIQKGIVREVQWKNIDGRILPFLNDQEVGFVPGKTWINIIPTNPGLEQAVSIQ